MYQPLFIVITNRAAWSSLRAKCPLLGFIPSPQLRAGAQQTAVKKPVAELEDQQRCLGEGYTVMFRQVYSSLGSLSSMSGGGWEERKMLNTRIGGFLGHVTPDAPGDPKLQPGERTPPS